MREKKMISKKEITEKLKMVIDPELGIDIETLGLVYEITPSLPKPKIKMTLTSPMCPYGPQLIADVKMKVKELKGVGEVEVEITFDPPWEPSEEVKMMLGMVQ